LHRIATALEHQLSLPSTPVQPGTEEPRDLIYLQQPPTQPSAATPTVAAPQVMAAAAASVVAGATPAPAAAQPVAQPAAPAQPSGQQPSRAGVNSMFGM
jgi:hypothetical protein